MSDNSQKPYRHHKVVDQRLINKGIKPDNDGLDHDKQAQIIYEQLKGLQPSSVVAIQAAWGAGKTDLLWRLALHNNNVIDSLSEIQSQATKDLIKCIWINPWRHGNADLITPITTELVFRLNKCHQENKTPSDSIQNTLAHLVRAGALWSVSYGVNQTVSAFGLNDILSEDAISKITDKLKGLINRDTKGGDDPEKEEDARWNASPVKNMPYMFEKLTRECIQMAYGDTHHASKKRILICIDDMDRCLPEQMVKLLESIHFLTLSGAPVTFVVAIDGAVAEKALATRYNSDLFSGYMYLDKIFDLNIRLDATKSLDQLLHSMIFRQHLVKVRTVQFRPGQDGDAYELKTLFDKLTPMEASGWINAGVICAGQHGELHNPRLWHRVFTVLELLMLDPPSIVRGHFREWGRYPKVSICWLLLRRRKYHFIKELYTDFKTFLRNPKRRLNPPEWKSGSLFENFFTPSPEIFSHPCDKHLWDVFLNQFSFMPKITGDKALEYETTHEMIKVIKALEDSIEAVGLK